jgi:hypothetical protein
MTYGTCTCPPSLACASTNCSASFGGTAGARRHAPAGTILATGSPTRKPDSLEDNTPMAVPARDYEEGRVAKTIENQTAKLPSDLFLWAAVGSMGGSLVLQIMGNQRVSLFIGQWAPTLLILGLYNKLVKQLGSDRTEHA